MVASAVVVPAVVGVQLDTSNDEVRKIVGDSLTAFSDKLSSMKTESPAFESALGDMHKKSSARLENHAADISAPSVPGKGTGRTLT